MASNNIRINGSEQPDLNWEIPDSKMPVLTRFLSHLAGPTEPVKPREPLRSESKHFSVSRADDCIWLNDKRSPTEQGTHIVPSQAEDLIELLINVIS